MLVRVLTIEEVVFAGKYREKLEKCKKKCKNSMQFLEKKRRPLNDFSFPFFLEFIASYGEISMLSPFYDGLYYVGDIIFI